MLDVALIGTGGMMPLPNRFLTAMVARTNGKMILVDCGEGTQVTLKLLGWGFKTIDIICITHYHADHIAGLPGLLLTIGNSGRTEPIHIYGSKGLQTVINGLLVIAPELPFPIITHEFSEEVEEITLEGITIQAMQVEHRIPCYAYSFYLKRNGKFDLERAKALEIPKYLWSKLQKKEFVTYKGRTYSPDMVLGQERKGIKISYCTDSRPVQRLIPFIENADLFICEGLYGDEEKLEKATKHKHMIFREAAELAKQANVSELWLTHYSPAMTNPQEFLSDAQNIFANTKAGYDRISKTILFE